MVDLKKLLANLLFVLIANMFNMYLIKLVICIIPPLVLVGIWHKHNSFHEHPFSEDDENMHKETCSLVKGSVASILFQYIENGKYIMNTYWVEENTISEKVEFVLKKDCARLIKTIYRAEYIKASLVRRMF